jgi:hypothetical protein
VLRAVCCAGGAEDRPDGAESARVAGAFAAGAGADWSAGRVVVPGRLKFCNSRGPIASVAGVLLGALLFWGSVVFWASAEPDTSHNSPATKTAIQRKIALIRSRSA